MRPKFQVICIIITDTASDRAWLSSFCIQLAHKKCSKGVVGGRRQWFQLSSVVSFDTTGWMTRSVTNYHPKDDTVQPREQRTPADFPRKM